VGCGWQLTTPQHPGHSVSMGPRLPDRQHDHSASAVRTEGRDRCSSVTVDVVFPTPYDWTFDLAMSAFATASEQDAERHRPPTARVTPAPRRGRADSVPSGPAPGRWRRRPTLADTSATR